MGRVCDEHDHHFRATGPWGLCARCGGEPPDPTKPTAEPAIQNIRDLLVVAMAPELQCWGEDRGLHLMLVEAMAVVAFVLDHTTAHSFKLLAELHGEQTNPEKKPS